MTDSGVFETGYDACWEGIDSDDNPYDQESEPEKHLSWLQGWREAQKHDYDESD